jgi:hypothetical protein
MVRSQRGRGPGRLKINKPFAVEVTHWLTWIHAEEGSPELVADGVLQLQTVVQGGWKLANIGFALSWRWGRKTADCSRAIAYPRGAGVEWKLGPLSPDNQTFNRWLLSGEHSNDHKSASSARSQYTARWRVNDLHACGPRTHLWTL